MRLPVRLSLATLAVSTLALVAGPVAASAAPSHGSARSAHADLASSRPSHARTVGFGHSVFVQTDASSGNQIDAFYRGSDGRLTLAGVYNTGGNGGSTAGSTADHLSSQNSLVYDRDASTLYAVNAGSDSISVFYVIGDRLVRTEVLSSGGQFPVSIAVRGHLLYVLNAGGPGTVQGFVRFGPFLIPIPGASRSLGLANTTPPNFLMSPGDVGFTPDGGQLIVTTKLSGSDIDVFRVGRFGHLSAPVINPSATPVPFAFSFGPNGLLVMTEAGTSSVSTYVVNPNGTLTAVSSLTDGQVALCWITPARGFYYGANSGSNNLSAYRVGAGGALSLVGSTGIVASTDGGPIDMAASNNGHYLYVEAGAAGAIDEFSVNPDGTLSSLGTVAGLNPGIEGIATN